MNWFIGSCAVLFAGGALGLLVSRRPGFSLKAGLASQTIGCALGLVPVVHRWVSGKDLFFRRPWAVPMGEFFIGIDALSAFFLFVILAVSLFVSLYGAAYLREYRGRKNLGVYALFFNTLIASMMLVVTARNAVLFLVAWEVMTLASYFLVVFEHEKEGVRRAGILYLAASHVGAAFLFLFFLLAARQAGSAGFDRFLGLGESHVFFSSLLFVFCVLGFGVKAGFVPLHIWLPEAHPAAPGPVSALMSGVMIKMGIYGLLRSLTFLDPPCLWWGLALAAIGLVSGIFGVLMALAQHDLKRLLAYHSVENIGIIALGIGVGLLGKAYGNPWVGALGFGGALLHVLNHGIFKSLLFLGAGSVMHAAGTGELDRLGGLLKRMPFTGAAFLTGSAAISGLPLLNGFVSEWLIYAGSFYGVLGLPIYGKAACIFTIVGLALIGGLALACFTKAFGVVFLGAPREGAGRIHESGALRLIPMIALALACVAIGILPAPVISLMAPLIGFFMGGTPAGGEAEIWKAVQGPLQSVTGAALALAVLWSALMVIRRRLLSGRKVCSRVTWDCGYAFPTPRMQSTASSFAWPLSRLFSSLTGSKRKWGFGQGIGFAAGGALKTETKDAFQSGIYWPLWSLGKEKIKSFKWLQQGRLSRYLIYIFSALLFLLLWKMS